MSFMHAQCGAISRTRPARGAAEDGPLSVMGEELARALGGMGREGSLPVERSQPRYGVQEYR